MPKAIRSNATSSAQARRKYEEDRKREDNLFPDESPSRRKSEYGSRTREAEERERDRDRRDDDRGRDRDRDSGSRRRDREVDERDSTRRGREESSRDDRRLRSEGRSDRSDSSRSRDSKELAEIRYQLNRMYNFIKDFEKDMSKKEIEAWDTICSEADAEEFCLNGRGGSSRRRDRDDDRRDRDGRRDRDDRDDRRDSRSRRRDDDRDDRRDGGRRGDDEGMSRRHRGQDRYESNGLVKGDIKLLLNVIDDENLRFRGALDDDLFYITEDLQMGNYSRNYEDAFLNLLRELDEIKLKYKSSREDVDYLMDIYMPKRGRDRRDDDRDYDRDRSSRRRESDRDRRDRDDDSPRRRRVSGSSRRDRRDDDYYDRDDRRRDDDYDRDRGRSRRPSRSSESRRRDDDRYDDRYDRDRDDRSRDSRRRSSGRDRDDRRRDDDRYSGRNGGRSQRGRSGFDFDYLDDVLYDLEGLPGFIDDLTDFGYEAYSYLASAVRTKDDSGIAEDSTVFMEELINCGMDYALTDDEYDFLMNEASRYQSVANRYVGRQAGNQQSTSSRRTVYQRQAVAQPSRRRVSSRGEYVDNQAPVRDERTVTYSRRLPANEPVERSSRSVGNSGKYAGRNDDCVECRNYEPRRAAQKYAGRTPVSRARR